MNVYQCIRNFAETSDVEVSEGDVAKIAGALRTAGLRGELSERDQELALPLIAKRVGRVSGAKTRVAEAQPVEAKKEEKSKDSTRDQVVEGSKDKTSFEKIDAMVKQGKCARCGQPTEDVALHNYESVHYCPGCRTTLW